MHDFKKKGPLNHVFEWSSHLLQISVVTDILHIFTTSVGSGSDFRIASEVLGLLSSNI